MNNWINNFLHGRINLLDGIRARHNQQKFEQFVILGFNCETAFRFYCRWGFLDSSLFAWANTICLETLTKAICDFPALGTGEFAFHQKSRMWMCANSGIFFHGRLRAQLPGQPEPTEDVLAADREELRSRIAHLKEKFASYATNEKSTLFVYRIGFDVEKPGLAKKLDNLEAALVRLGARNWKLLVVCRRADLPRMPAGPNRIFRAVSKFNPTTNVTTKSKGDSIGWNRIFTEFAPVHVLKKAHDFKFEH